MPIYTQGPEQFSNTQAAGIENLQSSFGQSVGAAAAQGFDATPTAELADMARHWGEASQGSPLSAKDANAQYGIPGTLHFDAPVSSAVASDLNQSKRQQILRQTAIDSGPQGIMSSMARGAAGAIPQFMDPINIGAAFVPGLGDARMAAALSEASAAAARSGLGRAAGALAAGAERTTAMGETLEATRAGRALQGASQGMLGQAALEPLNYAFDRDEHNDWSMGQALGDIAFGGLLGGGLHMLFPRARLESEAEPTVQSLTEPPDAEQMMTPMTDRAESLTPDQRGMLVNEGVSALVQDRPNLTGEMMDGFDPEGARASPGTAGPAEDGGTALTEPVTVGQFPEGVEGAPSLPIMLEEGYHDFSTPNGGGVGRAHIEARHGAQIRQAGYDDAVHYVRDVVGNASEIRRDHGRDSLFMIRRGASAASDSLHDSAALHLVRDENGFYRVGTASPYKFRSLKKMRLLWEAPRSNASSPTEQGSPSFATARGMSGTPVSASDGSQSNAANLFANAARRKILEDTPGLARARRDADLRAAGAPDVAARAPDDALGEAQKALADIDARFAAVGEEALDEASRAELAAINEEQARDEGTARAYEAASACLARNV